MRLFIKWGACFSLLVSLYSCEKNSFNITETTAVTSADAQVKVAFFSTYRANPSYQIVVNDSRVSNTLNATGSSPNPTPFPGGGLNTGGGSTADYLAIKSGDNKIAITIPKFGTNTDSVSLVSGTISFGAGKKYSLYYTDTSANTSAVLVEDSLMAPDSGFAKYKFVNLIPDIAAVDLYIGTVKVASAIPYKGVSASFILPTNNSSTVWAIRSAGSGTNLATYTSGATLGNQRVFSVIARGYSTISTSSDVRRRAVCLIYNQ